MTLPYKKIFFSMQYPPFFVVYISERPLKNEGGYDPLNDHAIMQLYLNRSENAIAETGAKYGAYCLRIANNILANREDAEECVNDAYLAAWNSIPPHRPAMLSTYLGKLVRNISINRWKSVHTYKRGGSEMTVALDELLDLADGRQDVENQLRYQETAAAFNRFLGTLPKTERDVFLRRYWFVDPIADIAASFGFTQSKVASMLLRTRKKLRRYFEQEDIL